MPKLIILVGIFWGSLVHAQVYAPQGEEFAFRAEAYFDSSEESDKGVWRAEAEAQISHSFGVFQSPKFVRSFDISYAKVAGIGAVQFPINVTFTKSQELESGLTRVYYNVSGKILLHNKVVAAVQAGRDLVVPLPVQLDDFYDIECTDEHYQSEGDFWYFYDPYRTGCGYLRKPPLSAEFRFELKPSVRRKLDMDVRLDLLRGDNDNGNKLRIDVIHGFDESSGAPDDIGREAFEEFNATLRARGFTGEVVKGYRNRPHLRFVKTIVLPESKIVEVEINSILVETTISAKTVTFAKFLKESVKDADVIYYAGHSGLGGNLDIGLLEQKAGGFEFNSKKRQVFVFDSCSSYSYYLDSFRSEKTRARIDVITNALASLFDTGTSVLMKFLDEVLDTKVKDKTWPEFLSKMESGAKGRSYLLNVGGI